MKTFCVALCSLALAGMIPFYAAADGAAPAEVKPAPAAAKPAAAAETPAPAFKTEKETRSYAIGMSFGKSLKRIEPNLDIAAAVQGVKDNMAGTKNSYLDGLIVGRDISRAELDVDPDLLLRGIKDAAAGGNTLLSEEEFQKMIAEVSRDVAQKQIAKNKKKGEDFLSENKKKEGVVILPSGLQYKVIKEGEGATPAATDTVSVNYRGTFVDGTEFDSSYKRGKPQSLTVNGVIPGWSQALQKMKVGSKWQVFVPSDLAYGAAGNRVIPPDSALIFEVELLAIEAPKAASPFDTTAK